MTQQEDNILEFPTASEASSPAMPTSKYHFAAFRVTQDGKTVWYDGVVELDGSILTQEHYLGLKKMLCQNYDIREENFVITSLSRLDSLQLVLPPAVETSTNPSEVS